MHNKAIVHESKIQSLILIIRGERVIIDADLASIYGATTKRLNEQVRRNIDRFPADFMFQLTEKEKNYVVANCDHLNKLKFSSTLPYAFTEHGAFMAANVLNSTLAVEASILVVRVFVKIREVLATHKELAAKIERLERKFGNRFNKHDKEIQILFEAIRQLMQPPNPPRRKIGYKMPKKK
jgi:hypothetical protein